MKKKIAILGSTSSIGKSLLNIIKKKAKKTDPWIIKNIANGIKMSELNILFSNSLSSKYSQNFYLYSYIS